MSSIEVGSTFKVGYGSGRSIEVIALSIRQRRELVKAVERVNGDGSPADAYDSIEKALKICCANYTEDLLDSLDEETAMEIVSATMQKAVLSEDDKKE